MPYDGQIKNTFLRYFPQFERCNFHWNKTLLKNSEERSKQPQGGSITYLSK